MTSAPSGLGLPSRPPCTLYEARVSRQGDLIYIDLRGTASLYHMARMIAGTLIRVGKAGSAARSGGYTESRDSLWGLRLARGLCLERVEYGEC